MRAASGVALALYLLFLVLAFGARSVAHHRLTGSFGYASMRGTPWSAQWWARLLFLAALLAGLLTPSMALLGLVAPRGPLTAGWVAVTGAAVAVGGIALTLYAQAAMGRSWRVGVDPHERTELVTGGPFRHVRNPIFTAMSLATLGLTLLVPTRVALGGLVALTLALQLQVRRIEEPYLLDQHGQAYRNYARRTGRFLPGIGRMS